MLLVTGTKSGLAVEGSGSIMTWPCRGLICSLSGGCGVTDTEETADEGEVAPRRDPPPSPSVPSPPAYSSLLGLCPLFRAQPTLLGVLP
ncbi:hypothetical protein H8958_012094, partial [Nasalis larvatus]